MQDNLSKEKLMLDINEQLKNSKQIFTVEDIENAINTLYFAKLSVKEQEQKRVRAKKISSIKQKEMPSKIITIAKGTKSLPPRVFQNRKDITGVILNKELSEIGEYAFAGCTNLKRVSFANCYTTMLRKGCFKDCASLTTIAIPNVSNIGPAAFSNCISLKEVTINNNFSNIYTEAFKGCYSLKKVNFKRGLFQYGWGNIFARAFEGCESLENIELTKGIYLDDKVFIGCKNLKSITCHKKIKKFVGCNAKINYI